jgi:hypothetical protein
MNFIEVALRIAPDAGSGATELAILLVCACVPVGVYWLRRRLGKARPIV